MKSIFLSIKKIGTNAESLNRKVICYFALQNMHSGPAISHMRYNDLICRRRRINRTHKNLTNTLIINAFFPSEKI